MEQKYSQICDFQYIQAKKMENSSYLEELTGLLSSVASHIDDESSYFWGNEYYMEKHNHEPNSSFEHFVKNFKNVIDYESCNKINIIRGRAGIGKTLFFKKGIKKVILPEDGTNDKYIRMGVDFKNIDNDKDVKFYEDWIYEKLFNNAIDGITCLSMELYKEFRKEYSLFGNEYRTPNMYLYPLAFFCKKIFNKYGKPCIIIFDNIDLASVKTQKNVFDAVGSVCDRFNDYMKMSGAKNCYRIFFAMRPETELRYNECGVGNAINFPLPNILKIFLAIMKKALTETAYEFDSKGELACHVSCQNVMSEEDETKNFEKFIDVADYFYQILDYYLDNIWNRNQQTIERLGTVEEFHCNIVNYNVRTFLRFLSDTISNGGFKPFTTEFNKKQGFKNYNLYDYIEMIIRGRWYIHPGNVHISGEGSNKAPIVFNVFDTSLYGNSQDVKVKHFMLNIRILQYFFLRGNNYEVDYKTMEQDLGNFFDPEYIKNATKKLIHVHFLYSYVQGDNLISTIENWEKVIINETTTLKLSPVGGFYLEKFICEFEYQYQMAISSFMCVKFADELGNCYKSEKEQTVLYFLKSMFEIIKDNIIEYSPDEIIPLQKLFYYIDDNLGSRPFRRMVERFIAVMKNKVQRAEQVDSNSVKKLTKILQDAETLQKEAESYFLDKLGNQQQKRRG